MNSRTHEPREYRGNLMPADISTLPVYDFFIYAYQKFNFDITVAKLLP